MSKKKDPKDVAIEFVMTQPIEAAAMFVQTLGSIVKARASGIQLQAAKPAVPKAAGAAPAPSRTARTRAAAADKPGPRLVAPEELATDAVAAPGGGAADAVPLKSQDTLLPA